MIEQGAFRVLEKVGAILMGHFVLTSDKHASAYVNKDAVYLHTEDISLLCWMIAEKFVNREVRVVIAPAIGGVILSQWVAHHLTNLTGEEVLAVYAEKADNGSFVIKRGYDKIVANKNVLVVEDILTTGGSVKKVVEATRANGGNVIGVSALCNRGGITPQDIGDVPELFALVDMNLESWDEASCPLCAQNIPINTDVGKGKEYLARKQSS